MNLDNTGFSQVTPRFDNNGAVGLSSLSVDEPPNWLFILDPIPNAVAQRPAPLELFPVRDGAIQFRKISSEGLLGTWLSTTTENDLLMIVFFDDGTYFHGEVDEDDDTEISGMELGTYEHDEATGLMTVTMTFDNNGSTGLTDFVGIGAPNIFVEVSGDTLTATIDEDGDELIDETIIFQRQHL